MGVSAGGEVLVKIGATVGSGFNSAFSSADATIKGLGATVGRLESQLKQSRGLESLRREVDDLSGQYSTAKNKADELRQSLAGVEKLTREQKDAMRAAEREAAKLATALDRKRAALDAADNELKQAGVDTARLADHQKRLGREIGENTAKLNRLGSALDRQRAASEAFGRAQSMAFRGAAMTAAVAIPAVMAQKAGAEFDYQLQLIGNTADLTQAQIGDLGDTVMKLSRETGQGANELQRALGYLVAAGMDVGTAERSIGTIGKVATAFAADIEDTSKAAFVLVDALQFTPEQLGRGLDIIAAAGKEGNVELRDMAKLLPVLGGGFSALKMQGSEAVATMGAALQIAKKGAASADEAGNNMQNFLAKLSSPETLKKARENFGIDLYAVIQDAQRTGGNPFEAAMNQIIKATEGDQKKIGELFADMQVQNFVRPLIQNWDEYQRIKDKALLGSGTTDRDFEKMRATAKQQMDEMGQAFDRTKIRVGAALTPAFAALAKAVTPVIEKIGKFAEEHPNITAGIVAIAGAVGALTTGLGLLGMAVSAAKIGMASMSVAASTLAGGGAIGGLTGAVTALGAAIMATPIGWIAAGIAAVGAALYLVWRHWDQIAAFGAGFWDGLATSLAPVAPLVSAIGDAFGIVFGWVSSLVGWFGQLLAPVSATNEQLAAATTLGQQMGQAVGDAVNLLLTPFRGWLMLINEIRAGIGWIIDGAGKLGSAIGGAYDATKGAIGGAWQSTKDAAGAVSGWFGGDSPAPGTAAGPVPGGTSAAGALPGWFDGNIPAPGTTPAPVVATPAAAAAAAAANVSSQTTNQITINGAQDPQATARAVSAELDRRDRERRASGRSMMIDAVGY